MNSEIVTFDCVKFLVNFQEKSSFKLQPKLSSVNVNPTQYQKMRVNLAANVFDFDTVAALLYIKEKYDNPNIIISTATFFKTIAKWFAIISSKRPENSINENSEYFQANIDTLNRFITLMKSINYTIKNKWRPIQTGFILTTTSILNLYYYLSNKYGINEIIPRRLTTDTVENLFSQIRGMGQAHPNSINIKNALKRISFASHIDISLNSNYSLD